MNFDINVVAHEVHKWIYDMLILTACHRLVVISTLKWCALRGKELRGLGIGSHVSCKLTHDFPIPLNAKFCAIYHRLAVNSMSNYAPQFELPVWGWRGLWGRNWYQSKCRPCIPIRLFYLAYLAPSSHNRQSGRRQRTDRQTEQSE